MTLSIKKGQMLNGEVVIRVSGELKINNCLFSPPYFAFCLLI